MQLPSSLISVADSAVQNAEQAGYVQQWPTEITEQFRFVSGLSQFITEAIHRDETLAQDLPSMLAERSRQQAYRVRLAELLAECQDEMLDTVCCANFATVKWSTLRGKTSPTLGC